MKTGPHRCLALRLRMRTRYSGRSFLTVRAEGEGVIILSTADRSQDSISLPPATEYSFTSSWRSSRKLGRISCLRICPWSCRLGMTSRLGRTRDGHDRRDVDCTAILHVYTTTLFSTLFHYTRLEQHFPSRQASKDARSGLLFCDPSHSADCICTTYNAREKATAQPLTTIGSISRDASYGPILAGILSPTENRLNSQSQRPPI
jgi:hypothetical protein